MKTKSITIRQSRIVNLHLQDLRDLIRPNQRRSCCNNCSLVYYSLPIVHTPYTVSLNAGGHIKLYNIILKLQRFIMVSSTYAFVNSWRCHQFFPQPAAQQRSMSVVWNVKQEGELIFFPSVLVQRGRCVLGRIDFHWRSARD